MGDINKLLSNTDKARGRAIINSHVNYLWDVVCYCKMIDFSFKGNKYMWLNKCYKYRLSIIFERLGQFLANEKWFHSDRDAQVHHLLRMHSDHCPFPISVFPHNSNIKIKYFSSNPCGIRTPNYQIKYPPSGLIDQAYLNQSLLLNELLPSGISKLLETSFILKK